MLSLVRCLSALLKQILKSGLLHFTRDRSKMKMYMKLGLKQSSQWNGQPRRQFATTNSALSQMSGHLEYFCLK